MEQPDKGGEVAAEALRPTAHQQRALDAMLDFADGEASVFILSGAAGTGKTTLMRAFVDAMARSKRPVRLLAPTGRAARVLGDRTGTKAATVHSHLYTHSETVLGRRSLSLRFALRTNEDRPDSIYIVDEASMVADRSGSSGNHLDFGSGRLLRDLVTFARGGGGESPRKIIFVGDPAQLPPVGEPFSPALDRQYIRETYDPDVRESGLTEVLRQKAGGAILDRAARIREALMGGGPGEIDLTPDGREIVATDRASIVTQFLEAVDECGIDGTVLITRTNRMTSTFNRRIRSARFGSSPGLVPGDRLIVVQNNLLQQLYNGDFVEVVRVSPRVNVRRPLKGITLTFREVTIRDLASSREIDTLLIENVLDGDTANLTPEEQQALIVDFQQRHRGVRPGSDAFTEAFRTDPYLNALRARYGYAVTCHKAQGGEWPVVFVAFDRSWRYRSESDFRWIYTAITRAKRRLVTLDGPT